MNIEDLKAKAIAATPGPWIADQVIDSDYRGEVIVQLQADRNLMQHIGIGTRIAQAMIIKLPTYELVEADTLSDTERGSGGFGSTGI